MGIDAAAIMTAFFAATMRWWDGFAKGQSPGGKWVRGENAKYANPNNPVFMEMVSNRQNDIVRWTVAYAASGADPFEVWRLFCKEFGIAPDGSKGHISDPGRLGATLINCVERLRGQVPTSIGT